MSSQRRKLAMINSKHRQEIGVAIQYHKTEDMEELFMRQEAVEHLISETAEGLVHASGNKVSEASMRDAPPRDGDDRPIREFVKLCMDMSLLDPQCSGPCKDISFQYTQCGPSLAADTTSQATFIYGPRVTAQDAMDKHQARARRGFELLSSSPTPSGPIECEAPSKEFYNVSATEPLEENAVGGNGKTFQARELHDVPKIFASGCHMTTRPAEQVPLDARYQKYREYVVPRIKEDYLPGNPNFAFKFCSHYQARVCFKWSIVVGFEVFAASVKDEVDFQGGFYNLLEMCELRALTSDGYLARWNPDEAAFFEEENFLNNSSDDAIDADDAIVSQNEATCQEGHGKHDDEPVDSTETNYAPSNDLDDVDMISEDFDSARLRLD